MMEMPGTYEFNVHFLQIIEKYPCLYNFLLPEYSNRNCIEKAWSEIAFQVNCSVQQCKTRWGNIGSSFLRHLRQKPPSGSDASAARKPYYLQANLAFLIPFTKKRKQASNLPEIQECIQEVRYEYPADDSQVLQELNINASFDSTNVNENSLLDVEDTIVNEIAAEHVLPLKRPSNENLGNAKKNKRNSFEDVAAEYSRKKMKKTEDPVDETEQEFMFFFRSLIPAIKKFNQRQKMTFKKKVLDAIENIWDEN